MLYLLRHALSVLALPTMAAVVVPIWIARASEVTFQAPSNWGDAALVGLGMACATVGIILFAASLSHFARRGQGTLAPWDPPRRLVISGPYRYVRNPMISGVLFALAGIALILRSRPHGVWVLFFALINATYIPLSEERGLARRFGDDYRAYCRHVRRFVPRLRPWDG